MRQRRPRRITLFVSATCLLSPLSLPLFAQGCEPIRFTIPVNLGGEGQAYQPAREWQLTLAYRRLVSNEWFVGKEENSALAPGGSSPVFKINTLVADVSYSLSDRYRLRLSVPVSSGSLSRTWPDKAVHEQTATGLGDVSISGEAWALRPRTHERGNIAVSIGVKLPTGSHTAASQFYTAAGPVDFPADQTIQPGDGGWAVILQTRGFRQLTERLNGYGFASYMVSPKSRSDVEWIPQSSRYWSVPDVYSARAGVAFLALPDQDLTVSLGARVDGIPIHDLIGGGDDETIKRTAYVIFADPGVSWSRGRNILTLSVPYRVAVNRQKSLFEQRTEALNAGGFAKRLVFASYTRRF
ncbi:MAG TPA: hypothetical protein VM099_14365 [Gemmatimonadaceae bacterium]|nr:hypothetical protein [Gemmatimonadaceae bacterium]